MFRIPRTMLISLCFIVAVAARSDTVILRSGETIQGEILRSDENRVTVRTHSGVSTYPLHELAPDWLDDNRAMLNSRDNRVWHGETSVAPSPSESFIFAWPEHPQFVVPVSVGLALVGLSLCFFGWKIFRFYTIVGGIFFGIVLGLVLGGVGAMYIVKALFEEPPQGVKIGVFLVLGLPLAILGAKLGRRFAMFGARLKSLGGLGSGLLGSAFALTHFAFFDLCVICTHALMGAILIVVGGIYSVSTLLSLADDNLQYAMYGIIAVALFLGSMGAIKQIKQLRSIGGNSSKFY